MNLIRQVGKSNVPWGLRVGELPLLLEKGNVKESDYCKEKKNVTYLNMVEVKHL